ncbi:hypothetical protein [Ferrimonas balearica]|uniref:hypothetical protein n=1 Tax=Ferrimonas balearica TaxID=44012 RepID=UPI001C94E4B0|nr:hypothetical protein [Ferrimonas balearica]MBY5981746.1 hypothetical protein [Ferrimonas balearica]
MSVINDTLKALELRGGRGALPKAVNVPASQSGRRPLPRVALLLVVLLIAVAWAWWPTVARLLANAPVEPVVEAHDVAVEPVAEVHQAAVESVAEVTETVLADDASSEASPAAPTVAVEPVTPPQPAPPTEPMAEPVAQVVPAPEHKPEAKPEPEPKPEAKPEAKPEPAEPQLAIQQSPLSPAEQARQLWQQAQQADNPEPMLEQALALDPHLHPARLALIERLSQRGEGDDLLLSAARDYPQQAAYPVLAAELALAAGDNTLAEQWLSWSQRLVPEPDWRARRAVVAQQLGWLELASEDYLALLNAEPMRGTWWFGLGYARDAGRDLNGAETAYRKALASTDLSQQAREFVRDRLTVLENR